MKSEVKSGWYWWFTTFIVMVVFVGCNGNDLGKISDRFRTSAALTSFSSCEDLETTLKENLKEEMRVQLLEQRYYYRMYDDALMLDGAEADNSAAPTSGGDGTRTAGEDYSTTNNQEDGVDEADFVKTDGYHIFVINGNRLEILGVPEFGEITKVSSIDIEGYASQMFIHNDPEVTDDERAVVFSTIYSWYLPTDHPLREIVFKENENSPEYARIQTLTKMTIIDISNTEVPTVSGEYYVEGYYKTGRKIDQSVHMVSYGYMQIPGLQYYPDLDDSYYYLDYDDPRRELIWDQAVEEAIENNNRVIDALVLSTLIPQIYERKDGEIIVHDLTQSQGCSNFSIAEDGMSRGITSILSLNVLDDDFTLDADHIVTNWSEVYASTTTMIIAEYAQDWWWYWSNDDFDEATNIHRFDLNTDGEATYSGSGRIPGTIRDQFSLSEYQGNIRVASTTGQWNRWWLDDPEEPENHVFVLAGEESLQVIGSLGGIAIGEQIWSSRFVGDLGFLVTFRQVDPLFTVDLSDPENPTIKGELKIPGVSTYIHPIDGNSHLLTIGMGGDGSGLDWATQVSLFDVTDFADPQLTEALSLKPETTGDGWSTYAWSEAQYEHKAFQYWGPMQMLAIPLSTYRYNHTNYDYSYEYVSQLALVSVDTEAGLELYGTIDHSDFFDGESYWYYRDVRRSIFMGDYIYAISDRGVTVHRVNDMQLMDFVTLPGNTQEYNYY